MSSYWFRALSQALIWNIWMYIITVGFVSLLTIVKAAKGLSCIFVGYGDAKWFVALSRYNRL
jgi:hypothetical protein